MMKEIKVGDICYAGDKVGFSFQPCLVKVMSVGKLSTRYCSCVVIDTKDDKYVIDGHTEWIFFDDELEKVN